MTKIIYQPRQTGKSTKIIKISSETQIPIIGFSKCHIEYIKDTAHILKLKIPEPIYVRDYIRLKMKHKEVLVDEVVMCLEMLIGCPIVVATLT